MSSTSGWWESPCGVQAIRSTKFVISYENANMGGELIKVWGLLYWYTLGPVVLLETYIDISGCFHIFPDHVHLFMTIMFLVSYGYVQQENTPFHRARFITDWLEKQDYEIRILYWPLCLCVHLCICGTKWNDLIKTPKHHHLIWGK